jgi:peptidylprolyl isomerase domain and WD repeat-containing protein 1
MVLSSRREPEDAEDATKGRDVFNEKPPPEELLTISEIGKATTTSLPENVVWNHFLYSKCCPKLPACKGAVYGSEGFEVNWIVFQFVCKTNSGFYLQILHTTLGDIHVRLYPEECPRTVENFTTHCHNGYYDNLIFHRVIKGFMVQTGDPLGDGTGGQSVWGGEFEDEFHKR